MTELAHILPYAADDVLSAARLRAFGINSHAVARLVREGAPHRLCRGWYAARQPTGPDDRHRLLSRAVVRHLQGRVAVSHVSRVVLAGLPLWRADLAAVHVASASDEVTRRRPHVVSYARVPGLRLERLAGLGPVVPLDVGIVQTGLVAGAMDAAIAADQALRRGLVTREALGDAAGLLAGHRGLPRTAAALARCDGRRESPGETRLAHLMADLGVGVTPQFEVRTRLGTRRADFRVDGTKVLLEMDGKITYTDPRHGGEVLWLEKRRQDAIEDEGWIVVRISWAELDDPARLWSRIRSAIARSVRRAV
jgi:very-short-patch-repair endonuclease